MKILKRLKELSLELAIADFGTGCSASSCVRTFPFDCLKMSLSTACPMKGVSARVTELLYLMPRPSARA